MQDVILTFVAMLLPGGRDQPAAGPLVRMDFVDDGFIDLQDVILSFIIKLTPTGLDTGCTP